MDGSTLEGRDPGMLRGSTDQRFVASHSLDRLFKEPCVTQAELRGLLLNFGFLEKPWDIFPEHVTKVELARKRHSIRMLNVACLCNWHIPVEHPVHADVASACLMN
jgi:hypothetical protein